MFKTISATGLAVSGPTLLHGITIRASGDAAKIAIKDSLTSTGTNVFEIGVQSNRTESWVSQDPCGIYFANGIYATVTGTSPVINLDYQPAPYIPNYRYSQKVINLLGSAIVQYIPCWEASGNVAADLSGNGYNGSLSASVALAQPGMGDGFTSMFFNGIDSYVNIYSASMTFPWATGSIFVWTKPTTLVWSPGRVCIYANTLGAGSYGRLIQRFAVTNKYVCDHVNNDTLNQIVPSDQITNTDWKFICYTWSTEIRGYLNGVELTGALGNSPVTGITSGSSTLADNFVNMGCGRITPAQGYYEGWIAHLGLVNRVLTAGEITDLYKIGG